MIKSDIKGLLTTNDGEVYMHFNWNLVSQTKHENNIIMNFPSSLVVWYTKYMDPKFLIYRQLTKIYYDKV